MTLTDPWEANLVTVRFYYAEELRYVAQLKSETLIHALSEVPKERYLGPGLWHLDRA
jgi:hypothetical protein